MFIGRLWRSDASAVKSSMHSFQLFLLIITALFLCMITALIGWSSSQFSYFGLVWLLSVSQQEKTLGWESVVEWWWYICCWWLFPSAGWKASSSMGFKHYNIDGRSVSFDHILREYLSQPVNFPTNHQIKEIFIKCLFQEYSDRYFPLF